MDRIEKLCAERGMRMTEQRRVIARVLSNAEDHPDVEELYRRASAIDPHISIATVYRTVRLFEEAGVVEKHDFGDGRSRSICARPTLRRPAACRVSRASPPRERAAFPDGRSWASRRDPRRGFCDAVG